MYNIENYFLTISMKNCYFCSKSKLEIQLLVVCLHALAVAWSRMQLLAFACSCLQLLAVCLQFVCSLLAVCLQFTCSLLAVYLQFTCSLLTVCLQFACILFHWVFLSSVVVWLMRHVSEIMSFSMELCPNYYVFWFLLHSRT